jgi:hypothetical protein
VGVGAGVGVGAVVAVGVAVGVNVAVAVAGAVPVSVALGEAPPEEQAAKRKVTRVAAAPFRSTRVSDPLPPLFVSELCWPVSDLPSCDTMRLPQVRHARLGAVPTSSACRPRLT